MKTKIIYASIVTAVLFLFVFVFSIAGGKSAEALAAEAKKKELEAMLTYCDVMVERVTECLGSKGSPDACEQLYKSAAWFQNRFGEDYQLACATKELFQLGE